MTILSVQSEESFALSASEDLATTLRMQSVILKSIHDFLYKEKIIQLMPVILSPITDPLNHPVHEAEIDYLGQKLQLTKSMILHKQIAVAMLDVRGIYAISPNVRLESGPKYQTSNKHLLEFSQVDIELRRSSTDDFLALLEDLLAYVFSRVIIECEEELRRLNIDLRVPSLPLKRYASHELKTQYGEDFEDKISSIESDPFWIMDFDREFYDKEDPTRKGHYLNYDLIYPEGFGEGLSGGERDYEYDVLVRKLKERKQDPEDFTVYMDLSKEGVLIPSAGGGLGVERLVRFITKKKMISEITPFPKKPGEKIFL
ncbi:MAG: asparagine synthetase A [Candidatus Hodarchaeales archaeon]|jgi:asparaginyl-tRNA synthetase